MNIQATKIELAKLILSIDNPDVIERLANFLQSETSDFWHSLTPEQQADIHRAIKNWTGESGWIGRRSGRRFHETIEIETLPIIDNRQEPQEVSKLLGD